LGALLFERHKYRHNGGVDYRTMSEQFDRAGFAASRLGIAQNFAFSGIISDKPVGNFVTGTKTTEANVIGIECAY
jgi:hypothetical protein